MSKVFAIGLATAVIGFAASQPANAGHRHCWGYGWYSYPSYSGYTYSNYGTYYYPSAPVASATVPPAPAGGQVARTDTGVYRSFSDEPGQAAPNATYQAAPMTAGAAPMTSSDYGTVGNPYGASGVTIGGVPSRSSNYGTANNPSGTGGMTFGGGTYTGGTSGGTAGHPY